MKKPTKASTKIDVEEPELKLSEATYQDIEFNLCTFAVFTFLGIGLGALISGLAIPEHANAWVVCLVVAGSTVGGGVLGAALNLLRSYCYGGGVIEYRGLPFVKADFELDNGNNKKYKIIECNPSKGVFRAKFSGPVCACQTKAVLKIYVKKEAPPPALITNVISALDEVAESHSSAVTKPRVIVPQFHALTVPLVSSEESPSARAPFVTLATGFSSFK